MLPKLSNESYPAEPPWSKSCREVTKTRRHKHAILSKPCLKFCNPMPVDQAPGTKNKTGNRLFNQVANMSTWGLPQNYSLARHSLHLKLQRWLKASANMFTVDGTCFPVAHKNPKSQEPCDLINPTPISWIMQLLWYCYISSISNGV